MYASQYCIILFKTMNNFGETVLQLLSTTVYVYIYIDYTGKLFLIKWNGKVLLGTYVNTFFHNIRLKTKMVINFIFQCGYLGCFLGTNA